MKKMMEAKTDGDKIVFFAVKYLTKNSNVIYVEAWKYYKFYLIFDS